jgi:hypothetical protein
MALSGHHFRVSVTVDVHHLDCGSIQQVPVGAVDEADCRARVLEDPTDFSLRRPRPDGHRGGAQVRHGEIHVEERQSIAGSNAARSPAAIPRDLSELAKAIARLRVSM